MKQEFVTLYGKAIVERNILHLRTLESVPFSETIFAQIMYPFILVIVFVIQFFEEDPAKKKVGIILWGFLLLTRLPGIYDRLIQRSYASRIPMNRIKSVSIEEKDDIGLNVAVILHLKNGRYRKIVFRRLEDQYQPFIDAVSQYITQPQPA